MIEVIGLGYKDVKKIGNTFADQIELCSSLENDGLSPSIKTIKKISKLNISQNICVMLRNHYDTFEINDNQLDKIIKFINKTKALNFNGYVFGAITNDKKIDFISLQKILESIGNKSLTFHKAFDFVDDKLGELKKLLKYSQINYVLTSGGLGSPLDNLSFFKSIPDNLKNRILIGGGVDEDVVNRLSKLGFKNFHSGKYIREDNTYSSNVDHKKIQLIKEISSK